MVDPRHPLINTSRILPPALQLHDRLWPQLPRVAMVHVRFDTPAEIHEKTNTFRLQFRPMANHRRDSLRTKNVGWGQPQKFIGMRADFSSQFSWSWLASSTP